MLLMRTMFTDFRPGHLLNSGKDRSLQKMFPLTCIRSFLFHTSAMAAVSKRAENMEKSREK